MPGGDDSVAQLRSDHTKLAASISAITTELGAFKIEKAVDVERDKYLQERLGRIEKSIDGIRELGRWALLAFFGALIAGFVTFLVKGGMNVPPIP
jgi:hypothetical protein